MTTSAQRRRRHPAQIPALFAVLVGILLAGASLAPSRAERAAAEATSTTTTTRPSGATGAAGSATKGSATPDALRLAGQTSWVAPEGEFVMHLAVHDVPDDAQLAVRFYNKVGGRILFGKSIDGDGLGQPLRPLLPALPLDALTRDGDGNIVASFPVSATTNPAFGVRLSGAGVYPVSVAVTDAAGRELDRFVTFLIRLPTSDTPGPALAVSVIVPVEAAPGFQPDGSVQFATGEAERLDRLATSLARTPGVPLSIRPNPQTLDALAALDRQNGTGTISGLARALAGREILAEPYADLDLGSWVASPLTEELDQQFAAGQSTIAALLGSPPNPQTAVADPTITPDALTELQARGRTQVVVPPDQLGPMPSGTTDVTLTQTFAVQTGSGDFMRAATADDELASRLTATDDPVLNAHLALADMAVLYLDRPNQSRGVVLSLPTDGSTPSATFDELLAGLADRSGDPAGGGRAMVSPVTTDNLFRVTDPAPAASKSASGATLVRPYLAPPPGSMGTYPAEVDATRDHLAGFASLVNDANEQMQPLRRQILVSGTATLDDPTRSAYLDGVDTQITDATGGIVAPAQQNVTLTARSGNIPLTLENQLPYPVEVSVSLTSEKLEFPDGGTMQVSLPAASATRIEIAVETRASGSFPLDVAIRSADGSLPVATTRFTVRSTAISGLGLALSIGAGLFLLVWWARHFRKVRRARRLVESAHPAARPGQGDEGAATSPEADEQAAAGAGGHGPVSYAPADTD